MRPQAELEELIKLFGFKKKQDLERHCKELVITERAFADMVLGCKLATIPMLHQIHWRDKQPEHLHLNDRDHQALKDNGVGDLNPAAAKAVRKIGQMFEERRYMVGHMFMTPDLYEWHFFAFDQRDLEDRKPNHWKEGPHIHFTNWLWPNLDAESIWTDFVRGDWRPGASLYIRCDFSRSPAEEEEESPCPQDPAV